MMRCDIRVNQAKDLVAAWDRKHAFMVHFRQMARKHKEWGGRDRREIADLSFAYFRLGPLQRELKDKAWYWAAWIFLPHHSEWLAHWKDQGFLPEPQAELPFTERLELFRKTTGLTPALFPFPDKISKQIDIAALEACWGDALRLWFRAKKEKAEALSELLTKQGVPFERDNTAFSLAAGTDMEALCGGNYHLFGEVQDQSSQQVVKNLDWNGKKIWDCCAASGGKALHILDEYPQAKLTCSDVRSEILVNLKERFMQARLPLPQIHLLDLLGDAKLPLVTGSFDAVLCDAPCSGSGTFRRNPEAMVQFTEDRLNYYIGLQKKIVKKAITALKPGGTLLYATCSMYAGENEEQLAHFEKLGLKCVESSYFNGSDKGADILFRAVLKKA